MRTGQMSQEKRPPRVRYLPVGRVRCEDWRSTCVVGIKHNASWHVATQDPAVRSHLGDAGTVFFGYPKRGAGAVRIGGGL